MILDRSSVILVHLKTQQKQKRHKTAIHPNSNFEKFREEVKELYQITDNEIDLIVQQQKREIALNEQNFQHFKETVHLNKIITVKEHNILNLTYMKPRVNQQNKIKQPIEILQSDLQPIHAQNSQNDCSSFFADDFRSLIPFLQSICMIKPQIQYNQQEKLTLMLIKQITSSIKPAIQNFYSKQGMMDKLN